MGLDRIKIKKEKCKDSVELASTELVKEIQKFLRLANYYRQFVKNFAKTII